MTSGRLRGRKQNGRQKGRGQPAALHILRKQRFQLIVFLLQPLQVRRLQKDIQSAAEIPPSVLQFLFGGKRFGTDRIHGLQIHIEYRLGEKQHRQAEDQRNDQLP